jgi:hypothetical protein
MVALTVLYCSHIARIRRSRDAAHQGRFWVVAS